MADLKREKRKLLGQFFLESGIITKEQLQKAIDEQKKTGSRIGKALLDLGFIKEPDLIAALGKQLNVPHIDLTKYNLKPDTVALIPEPVARRYELIALDRVEDTLTIAMVDPLNVFAIDEVQKLTKCRVEHLVCAASAIGSALERGYQKEAQTGRLRPQATVGAAKEEAELETIEVGPEVIELVNSIISTAAQERASDIHIEPEEENIRVRLRIDGFLHEIRTFSKESGPAIVSRIKVLSGIDIAEKRIPQDGRFRAVINGKDLDLRVSTLPTIFGEKVAMRLLDKSVILIELNQLGFQPEMLNRFQEIIRKPYGIILVTGPTSSGKTTTLYAALHTINSIDKNIITVEDPVEFHLKSVNQVQVNTRTGLTFATGLRSILRQDPNVIMVGEIRDLETAEIAIQSALTGHLVFSTIHTNNAPATLNRLIDMKVEPFLIASSVNGILAQRLIRLVCPDCKEGYAPAADLVKNLGLPSYGTVFTFYHGKGCDSCKGTGYLGRMGIFEFMTINDHIRELIISRASTTTIRQAARKSGMQTLREDGLQKVLKGQTTIEEVMRATVEEEG